MSKTLILPYVPEYYRYYVELAYDETIVTGLEKGLGAARSFLEQIPEEQGSYRYAEGKWSIKQVINHMSDNERIMAYRALRFARNDNSPLAGFEQDDYAQEDNSSSRTLTAIVEEFIRARVSSLDLFKGFSSEMLQRGGSASGVNMTTEMFGYILIGHALHHTEVLRTKYMN